MAERRERPYGQFSFLVDLGTGDSEAAEAGFQEVSGIGIDTTVAQYRSGKAGAKSVQKISGLNKSTDVTLKRGVVPSLSLDLWLQDIRNGAHGAIRTVTIRLQNEDHTSAVLTWKLTGARIVKHTSGPLNAKGTDVAMEELVLACERLEIE